MFCICETLLCFSSRLNTIRLQLEKPNKEIILTDWRGLEIPLSLIMCYTLFCLVEFSNFFYNKNIFHERSFGITNMNPTETKSIDVKKKCMKFSVNISSKKHLTIGKYIWERLVGTCLISKRIKIYLISTIESRTSKVLSIKFAQKKKNILGCSWWKVNISECQKSSWRSQFNLKIVILILWMKISSQKKKDL